MFVNQKANTPIYNNRVWFNRRAITNIIALKNLTVKYIVKYDINEQMFIAHRDVIGLQNMEFLMPDSGLH